MLRQSRGAAGAGGPRGAENNANMAMSPPTIPPLPRGLLRQPPMNPPLGGFEDTYTQPPCMKTSPCQAEGETGRKPGSQLLP